MKISISESGNNLDSRYYNYVLSLLDYISASFDCAVLEPSNPSPWGAWEQSLRVVDASAYVER